MFFPSNFLSLIPLHEIFVDCFVVSEFRGKHVPLTSAFQYVEYSTEHIVQIKCPWTSLLSKTFEQWLYFFKFLSSDITRVCFSHIWPRQRASMRLVYQKRLEMGTKRQLAVLAKENPEALKDIDSLLDELEGRMLYTSRV